jgi:hypothetical protein
MFLSQNAPEARAHFIELQQAARQWGGGACDGCNAAPEHLDSNEIGNSRGGLPNSTQPPSGSIIQKVAAKDDLMELNRVEQSSNMRKESGSVTRSKIQKAPCRFFIYRFLQSSSLDFLL